MRNHSFVLGSGKLGLNALIVALVLWGCSGPLSDRQAAGASIALEITGQIFAADHPSIQYWGRIDFSDPKKPKFSAAAIVIRARFQGTSIGVVLEDEHKWGSNRNYYDAIVDDGAPVKIGAIQTSGAYPVQTGLPEGEHTLTLVKRTESLIGYGRFLGLVSDGKLLPPPARPTRRIEIIGDSISAGGGIEARNGSPQCQEEGWGQPYNNARLAFGPVLARALGAEYQDQGYSGIGLVRNYGDGLPMPGIYDRIFLEDANSPLWDRTRFAPDVVVVALGTNDFSPGSTPRPPMEVRRFAAAYIDFLTRLRAYHQDAHIVCVSSPMLGDGWPKPTDTAATDLRIALDQVVDHFAIRGDVKVHRFFATRVQGQGCGSHPDVAQQAATAKELGTYLASLLGW